MAKDTAAKSPALNEYSAKRAFDATPEPAPSVVERRSGPLLFVIQMHSATRLHYDFRLECDGVLKSWAVPKGPSLDPADKRFAVLTEDHPCGYASFEGIIPPKQYGAGEVIVWDCGVYSPDEGGVTHFEDPAAAQREVREGFARGKVSVQLRGEKVKGSFALVKTKDGWLLIKHKDRFVAQTDITVRNRSILSGVSVDDLKIVPAHRIEASRLVPMGEPSPMPTKLEPMQAELGDKVYNSADWMWEPKLDGYRVIAFIDGDKVKLRSRRGLDLTAAFPKLAAELAKNAGARMILDGEIVCFDASGRPSFGALQDRVQLKTEREIAAADRATPVVFFCFDLLYFAGIDLRGAIYSDRRRYLAQCLMPSPLVHLVHASDDGVALHEAAVASGFEGVIGKRKASRYETGKRSASWIKVKPVKTADFLIGGYTQGKGSRAPLGAILVGYRDKKKLVYASHVGSGFDDKSLKKVKAALEPLVIEKNPFSDEPELNAPTKWVEPKLVAEVSYQAWTDDGHLRAPVFVRLRDDIDVKTVTRTKKGSEPFSSEKGSDPISDVLRQLENTKANLTLAIGTALIKLTHLDRVYWPANPALQQPALTKRDLLRYFTRMSPYIVPHLADRPLTMIRMPEGIGGERFFQKHYDAERPGFVDSVTVFSDSKDEKHEYLVCNNLPTLLWLAQMGTLELHVWHSRAKLSADAVSKSTDYSSSLEALEKSVLNYPDFVVFDLDPYIYSGEEKAGDEPELNTAAFEKGKEVAFALRELLHEMSLEPVAKTSGKTGLHIFVPIRRTIDFDAARHVSELVSRHLMRRLPKDITVEWSIPKRTGKIFMDYNMNVRGKTLNVAYSPRGQPGAPVSMPLTWDELAGAHPLDFRLTNAADRLAQTGDRWKDVLERKQSLEKALENPVK